MTAAIPRILPPLRPRAGGLTLALLTTVILGGCALSGRPDSQDPFAEGAGARSVRIHVLNHNFSDGTVWAIVQEGRRRRLGYITGKTDAVFTLPWDFSLPLRLEIDMVAGPRCLTDPIDVDPGDELQLEIQAVFYQTRGCRRR